MKNDKDYERDHWLDCKVTEIVEVTECDPGEAERIAIELLDTNRIPFGYTLYFEEFGYVTVADVLSNAEKYDQHLVCNPYRYSHGLGRDEAVFIWNGVEPSVECKDGRTYRFNV